MIRGCDCGKSGLELLAETFPLISNFKKMAKTTMYYSCYACKKIYKRHRIYIKDVAGNMITTAYMPYEGQLTADEVLIAAPRSMGEITQSVEDRIIKNRR